MTSLMNSQQKRNHKNSHYKYENVFSMHGKTISIQSFQIFLLLVWNINLFLWYWLKFDKIKLNTMIFMHFILRLINDTKWKMTN